MTINRTPSPGAQALEARQLLDKLAANLTHVARRGFVDFTRVDAAAAEFVLALVNAYPVPGEGSLMCQWGRAGRISGAESPVTAGTAFFLRRQLNNRGGC